MKLCFKYVQGQLKQMYKRFLLDKQESQKKDFDYYGSFGKKTQLPKLDQSERKDSDSEEQFMDEEHAKFFGDDLHLFDVEEISDDDGDDINVEKICLDSSWEVTSTESEDSEVE